MGPEKSFDDAEPLEAPEELTAEEKAAFERMERETPMPRDNQGGDPPPEGQDGKPRPKKPADKAAEVDTGDDIDDDDEDVTIDDQGRARNKAGEFVESVPKSALLRVKAQRKADREALDTERQEKAKVIGRLEILTGIINAVPDGKTKDSKETAPKNPWEEADVDETEDLLGSLQQQKRRNAYERQQREAMATGMQTRDQDVTAVQGYVADAKRLAAEHVKGGLVVEVEQDGETVKIPAFQAAYVHLVGRMHQVLAAEGITDPAQRDQWIAERERGIIKQAVALKRSPAEHIMEIAKAHGFVMPTKIAAGSEVDAGKSEKQKAAEKKLDEVAKGISATQSLSGKGGKAAGSLSAAQIIAMGDDDFDALVAKVGESQINKWLGAGA